MKDQTKLRCSKWDEYQHYKRGNKNYSNEQPWFKMYGRKLIGKRSYMQMKPDERDFLVTGCWCIGSQDNGFLPSPDDIAFTMRIDVAQVNLYIKVMLEHKWLEEVAMEDYKEIMIKVSDQLEENQRVNGLEQAKQQNESIHDMAARLSKSKTIKETAYGH
jgi:hypothetical protein